MFPDAVRDDVFRLDGPRLSLRWPRAADAAVLQGWSRGGELPAATDGERFVLAARADNAAGMALVLVATTGKGVARPPVGLLILRPGSETTGLHLSVTVAPAYRHRGFATEMLATVLPAVFGLTSCDHVLADVRRDDAVARRLLGRCGFVRLNDTRLRLDRRTWQRHHVVRRIPAMAQQAHLRRPLPPAPADV